MAWSVSRREKQTRRVSSLVALQQSAPLCMVTLGFCFSVHGVLKQIDPKHLAANPKFLKSFYKDCAILLSDQRTSLLAEGFAAKGWNQAGEGTEILRSCAKSMVHLSCIVQVGWLWIKSCCRTCLNLTVTIRFKDWHLKEMNRIH